jgi:H+/gluconate symporter-like permease
LIAGILLSKFFQKLDVKPPTGLHEEKHFERSELPGLGRSVLSALVPVILMLLGAVADIILGVPPAKQELIKSGITLTDHYYQLFLAQGCMEGMAGVFSHLLAILRFFSDANLALMTAVLIGIYTLGIRQGKKIPEIMKSLSKSVGAIAMIVLIIAAGGAFSQVLKDCRVNDYIAEISSGITINPLILAFSVAALIRLAIGSATVATMTAAPIMLPLALHSGVSPELMVLATGSGSLMFSHFNDIGFWMFKEYYNVSIKHTFAIWTVMECLVAIIGLVTALFLSIFI